MMPWQWADVRRAIDDSGRQWPVFVAKLPRSEIERLICSYDYWCDVVGNFDIDSGQAARAVYDEIVQRANCGQA